MNSLVKYEAARFALAAAHAVDEVKNIRDKAEAMAAYARQAKDTEMIAWVTEIKVRAERRAGQLLAGMDKRDGGHASKSRARSHDGTELPKSLADMGISKNESSRWQKLAGVSDDKFEHAVAAAKEIAGEVTTAAMLRATKAAKPAKPKAEAKPTKPALTVVQPPKEDEYTDLDAAQDQVKDLQDALVVANMGDVSHEDKGQAATLIAELRARIKALEQTLRAVTISRDTYQAENVQLRNQINRQRREIDKVTGRRTA